MKRILFLAACLCAAPLHAQNLSSAPDGWKTQVKSNGATTFTPPDLKAGESYSVTIYNVAPLNGQTPEAFLRAFAGPVGQKSGQLAQPLQIVQGRARVTSALGAYVSPNGQPLFVLFLGVTGEDGARLAVSRTLASRPDLLSRYKAENAELNHALVETNAPPAPEVSRPDARTPAPAVATPKPALGPMLPAKLGGAQVFLKFYWDYDYNLMLTFETGHLLLFPDGTAVDDIPREPLDTWSEAGVRQGVDSFRVGRWKSAGKTLILTFPKGQRTLTRTGRGWADPSGNGMEMGANCKVYLPAIPASRAQLLGSWTNDRLSVSGQMGGATPVTAAGSTNGWVFHPDGTFSGSKDSFFSSTTSGMGDAYSPGTDVTMTGKDKNQTRGQWRLDGPLLTLQHNGVREVHLAFLVQDNGKDDSTLDLIVDGKFWKRPKTK